MVTNDDGKTRWLKHIDVHKHHLKGHIYSL